MARALTGIRSVLNAASLAAAVLMACLGVYIAGVGIFNETLLRVGMFGFAAAIVLVLSVAENRDNSAWGLIRDVIDILLLALLVFSLWRYFEIGKALEIGLYFFSTNDLWLGVAGLAVLMELTRRSFGLPLVVVCLMALGYGLLGDSLPWIFRHGGFDSEQVLQVVWYSFDGVFGAPIAIVVTLILVFIVFGVLLEGIGAGAVLLKFALALTGRMRGGPAHAAIAASATFGTMSGSVAGNVVGTGVVTIPMIKERGFSARYAGGIEAAASSGGQFMPPIMGAVAFIMADVTGIPYLTICLAALMPALFYYGALFVAVHLEAVKRGIAPIPIEERPRLGMRDYLMASCFVVPLALVVVIMMSGRSPAMAGVAAVFAALILGLALNPELRRDPARILTALANGGRAASQIIIAVAAIGIVIGIMNMTGLGLRFAGIILSLTGDNLFLALVMMMFGSLILGMGMPTVPAYLVIILVMGPAIERMGVPTLIAHLFVVYFGVLSSITPPVAIAAFAAAPIAKANPVAIGIDACKVALIGFIIPFVLVYNPALSLVVEFDVVAFVWICLRLAAAIWLIATAFSGHAGSTVGPTMCAVRLGAGIGILMPWLWLEVACFAVAAAILTGDARSGALSNVGREKTRPARIP